VAAAAEQHVEQLTLGCLHLPGPRQGLWLHLPPLLLLLLLRRLLAAFLQS
jgi:hypothetical protein